MREPGSASSGAVVASAKAAAWSYSMANLPWASPNFANGGGEASTAG